MKTTIRTACVVLGMMTGSAHAAVAVYDSPDAITNKLTIENMGHAYFFGQACLASGGTLTAPPSVLGCHEPGAAFDAYYARYNELKDGLFKCFSQGGQPAFDFDNPDKSFACHRDDAGKGDK